MMSVVISVKRVLQLLLALQIGAGSSANAAAGIPGASLDLAIETRQGVNRQGQHALSELDILAGIHWKPATGWQLRVRARAESETELQSTAYRRLKLDEAHMGYEGEACSVRVGAQTIVWGLADRLRVLDLVHSLDLRENLFGDLAGARLPTAMISTECSFGAQNVQWLIVPQYRSNLRPELGSRFSVPLASDRIRAAGLAVQAREEPELTKAEDWSFGLKWASRLGSADVSLNVFHGWQGDPIYKLQSQSGTPSYNSVFERATMVGTSLAMPAGPVVLRAEASAVPNSSGYYVTPAGLVDSARAEEYRGLAGIDFQSANWFLSAQYFSQKNRSDQTLISPEWQRVVTLVVRRDLLQGRLGFTAYLAKDLTNPSVFLSIVGKYEFNGQWQGSVSFEHFSGNAASLGRFAAESRWVFGLRHSFTGMP
jgi:hypothetical protein